MIEKIYIDLDGVLADFDKKKDEMENLYPEMKESQKAFWEGMAKVDHLYLDLDMMPEASALMLYLESLNVPLAILTAIPRRQSIPTAEEDKKIWVEKNLGSMEFHIGPYSKGKQRFSKPGMVLIDDKPSNIDEWNEKGGNGILYTSLDQTIKAVEDLM